MAAVPDRHPAGRRARVDAGVLDCVEFARKGDVRLGPQRLHDAHLLLRAAAAVVEILVEPGKLDLVPADPDAEPEPPARQYVEACRLLRDERGLALRQDQHLRRKILDFRDRGEKPEQHERVVIGGRRGADAAPSVVGRRIDPEHVIGRHQMRVAEPFGRLGVVAQDRRTRPDVAYRYRGAELHGETPFA